MSIPTLPKHVAIIMDGNGRWAKQQHVPKLLGHKAGIKSVRAIVKKCIEKKIEVLSLFTFSSENWRRPTDEVNYLMKLFFTSLRSETKKLHEQQIQLRVIGDRTQLSETLCKQIEKAEKLTAKNTGLKLLLAVNYGGQWDMTQAFRQLAEEIATGALTHMEIKPELIKKKLSFADLPDPDLFIRTSGEQRISNFMLWQLAYTELYFTNVLWPDFSGEEFEKALEYFANRERRFGYTSEQIKEIQHA